MQMPLQVTFRNLDHSDALEACVRDKAQRLERFCDRITGCRVVVEGHRHKGQRYVARIHVSVPGAELVVGGDTALDHEYADVYAAVRAAFEDMARQVKDHAARLREDRHSGAQEPSSEASLAAAE